VRALGLKSIVDWREYLKSGKKPIDLPAWPNETYTDSGWSDWGDFLGTGRVHIGTWRSFKKARAFARKLHLKSNIEWRQWYRAGRKPPDIPANPDRTYKGDGWVSWGDWLGTRRVYRGKWRPFKKARAFVRSLHLSSWEDYRSSGKRPPYIPAHPERIYAEAGWAGMGDWLGTGRVVSPRWQESEAHTIV
jgi:Integrase repeat unit